MAKVWIYPKSITPKVKKRCTDDTWVLNRKGCKDIQPFTTKVSYNNLCSDNDNVSSWGDVNPDAVDHNNPVYSSNFYNTITTYSGSYDTPTSFTTDGWKNLDDIPSSAKIKGISVQYAWDQVKYTKSNNHVTWQGKGNVGHYQSTGGYFKEGPTISLRINGKTLSTTGPGVRSASNCTTKNAWSYSTKELKGCTATLTGFNGMTMAHFKKSKLTFAPSKNYASDVARIVIRHLRVLVEYEDIPATFDLKSISISPNNITNCPDAKSTLTIQINNNSVTKGKTQVKISGSGITNASLSNKKLTGSDTLKKKDNYYIWTVNTACKSRTMSVDLAYAQPGSYSITAKVTKNTGKTTSKKADITVNSCKPAFSFDFLDSNKKTNKIFKYASKNAWSGNTPNPLNTAYFRLILDKSQILNHNESLQINTDGLQFSDEGWTITADGSSVHQIKTTYTDNIYTFSNIKDYSNITIIRKVIFDESGLYNVTGKYINTTKSEWNDSKTYQLEVTGVLLPKDYFKLRLEDGSDVKYNSLMVTIGDDLIEPLTYTLEDINKYLSNIKIYGEKKRIPVNETEYVYFDIKLDTEEEVELKNVLTYIDIYTQEDNDENIIIGATKNVQMLSLEDEYICSIESITSKETVTIGLAVKSSVEIEDVVIKIKPYNYDGYNDETGWIPSHVMFKDIPNIKISIEGASDISYCEQNPNNQDIFWLYYKIQNLSNTDATNVRFQLKEPNQFQKLCYQFEEDNDCDNQQSATQSGAWFNKNNRIITFPELKANSAERILAVKYKANKKGIYKFKIHTLDNKDDLIDDQYTNSYTHEVMVNIPSDVRITTDISKTLPYIDELIDYHIKVKNLHKQQKKFQFDIYDIGEYNSNHNVNDYCIEYVKCKNGTFTPMHGETYIYPDSHENNKIGTWILTDIDIDDEYDLIISMRPKDIGNHIIKTVFTNELTASICPNEETKIQSDFYNEVKILEKNKQLEFNVYHAVSADDINCDECNKLDKICDDDFINLGDNIYYIFEIKNNSRNPISKALHVYARLPESFLVNGVLCSSRNYLLNQASNLISFTIPNLPGCQHEDSTIQFCIKIKPAETGKFTSNFSLSTRNSHVLYKQLQLTVDTEFNERKLEHEIKIYNFSKTNRNYRYEIDNVGEIFKFYNTGDQSLRPIDIESHSTSAIETYKGTNLRKLIKQIKKESKYVDPLFFKTGSNKLANKGYELFPDGLIRRFGLLNSEIYHYAGQFPITTDLVDRAMKWDIDTWDTKVWAGDDYDNGVFELSIDYSKVPSNFNILEVEKPIKNLQAVVDNVKPYGTKAICHYSATIDANIQINLKEIINQIKHDIDIDIILPDDFSVISAYNRFDNTVEMHYDLMKSTLKAEIDNITNNITSQDGDKSKVSSRISQISTHIFADKISKQTVKDCYQMIANTYDTNMQDKNIDITKPFTNEYNTTHNVSLSDIQIINFKNILDDKESIGFVIKPLKDVSVYTHNNIDDTNNIKSNTIYCVYHKDNINDFSGFRLILNNNIIEERNINSVINDISIQIQFCTEGNNNILHFWGSINKEDYYHIGLLVVNDFNTPIIDVYNINNKNIDTHTINQDNDKPISFKITEKEKQLHKQFDSIYAIEKNNKWQYLKRIKQPNKYAYFENTIDIDKECESRKINIPKLVLKYNNIDIDDLDEIVDIQFKIEAQSNKNNFANDININLFKDGDKYIPENKLAHEIVYPETITNSAQEFLANITLEQENMTICSNCLKTALGYHNTCPYCESSYVRHSNEKQAATTCHNCGWIINGWNDYCKHCLSYDVEKIQIDYNKTYCEDCGALTYDYYEHCPQCFSSNVLHLTNNTTKYQIFDEKKQNIQPITINIDPSNIDKNNKIIDIFSLYVPFKHDTEILKQLEYVTLKIHGTNHNNGQYYYCESCNSGGLGNYDTCPYCGSKLVHNQTIDNNTLQVSNGETIEKISIPYGQFIDKIDLKTYANYNYRDKFKLTFSVENQAYDNIIQEVLNLPIKDEYIAEILNVLPLFNITIDNLSIDYKYKNTSEWVDLQQLQGLNHTGIKYVIPNNKQITDAINFKDFNLKGEYLHAYLHINGLTRYIDDNINMEIKIMNNNKIYYKTIKISDMLFNYSYDIIKDIGEYISDLSIEIKFETGKSDGEIIITNCDIDVEYPQYKNNIHDNVNIISSEYINEHNDYLFKSLNNNLWGLNNTPPYYLSGRQLSTNLIGYIDFGKLDLQEYIRVYNIDMIITYKSKSGYITTETISDIESNQTYQTLLMSAGYSIAEVNEKMSNDVPLLTALKDKGYNIDKESKEQLISGNVINKNSIFCGSINYDETGLNNLESDITNINNDDELISAIPLYYKIAQSFNTGEVLNSISTIYIDYFGKRGYPNDIINVYLCKDYDGKPGNIISSGKITTNGISEILNVNIDTFNLQLNTTYWIVLEDVSADRNNYHRFNYNIRKEDKLNNLSIEQCITYDNKQYKYQNYSLSFGLQTIKRDKTFYDLPVSWLFDTESFDGYKIHNILYRYNIQEGSNISLSNFLIKSGYILTSIEPTLEDEEDINIIEEEATYDEEYEDEDSLEDVEIEGDNLPEPDEEDNENYEDEEDDEE